VRRTESHCADWFNRGSRHLRRGSNNLRASRAKQNVKAVFLPHHRARGLRRDQADAEKKLWARRGYSAIRFWDAEVLTDIYGVLRRIDEALGCGPRG